MKKLKQIYLEQQKKIAEPFFKGGFNDLGNARIVEAIRVSNMTNEDFIDYVGECWINNHQEFIDEAYRNWENVRGEA